MSDERNDGLLAFWGAAEEIFQSAERLRLAAVDAGRGRLISVTRMVWEATRLARWLGGVVASQYPPERVAVVLPIQSVVLPNPPVENFASASPGSPGSVTTTVGDRSDGR
mgnify:CR=1 FL=1